MVYNLETIMVMGNVKTPSSSHAYSYVNFQNILISSSHAYIRPKILQFMDPSCKFFFTHLTLSYILGKISIKGQCV